MNKNRWTRRQWLTFTGSMGIAAVVAPPGLRSLAGDDQPDAIAIGSQRELFVDNHLIEQLAGTEQRLHHPTPREIAIVHDAPWEGAGSGYHTVMRDGDRYRMFYRGSALGVEDARLILGNQVCCYAESQDGIVWEKPELGLHEHQGSSRNNIIWTGVGVHNFAPFLDANPNCPADARFKALAGTAQEGGLFALKSADAIHWSLMRPEPVVTRAHSTRKTSPSGIPPLASTEPIFGRSPREPRPARFGSRRVIGPFAPPVRSTFSSGGTKPTSRMQTHLPNIFIRTRSRLTSAHRTFSSAFRRVTSSAVGPIPCAHFPNWLIENSDQRPTCGMVPRSPKAC